MTRSLRALLAGSIDYAGMFPPAGLPLGSALDELRRHRSGSNSWMLGRFVVPVAKLAELAESYEFERDGRLAVIVAAGDSGESFLKQLDAALTNIAAFPISGAVDTLEFRWPAEPPGEFAGARLGNLVQTAAGEIVASRIEPITMFFELPRHAVPSAESTEHEITRAAVKALAEYNRSAKGLHCQAGFKLRCGGTETGIPASAEVAAVICECRDQGVFWKATAGLHRPLRNLGSTQRLPAHGFLNLFVATVLAHIHHLDEPRTQAIIDTVDARQFGFTADAMNWGDLSITSTQIAAARERSLRSFGSCSFDEPCQDLRGLGML